MWNNVLGHTQIKEFLANYLSKDERPHALLFSGAEGLGKKKLALEFARSLLCFNHSDGDGCEACRLMNISDGNFSHPDFLHIHREEDPKTHRLKDLGIDQIRDLTSKSAFAPVMSSTKVCIVEDIDRMSEAAANSFLKLLEEPPVGWIFILLATSADKLLSTVLSRVVHLRFHSIPLPLVEKALAEYVIVDEKNNKAIIPKEQIPVLARLSEGSLGLAIQFSKDNIINYREQAYAFIEVLPLTSPLRYLNGRVWVEKYERPEALLYVQLLQLLLRDMLACKLEISSEIYNCDLQDKIQELAEKWKLKNIRAALNIVNETYSALIANVGVKLAMEAMALKIDKISKE